MAVSTRHLAMFGPRNAGKTVFLAALYGSSQDGRQAKAAYHVSAAEDPHDPTHRYLSDICRYLVAGKWPDATVFSRLPQLTIAFTAGGVRHDLVLPDIAGEITRRAEQIGDFETAQAHLKAEFLSDFENYHGYLVFVAADETERLRSLEYKWEVDVLLNALKKKTPDGGLIHRPLAVIVSKWDLVSPTLQDEATEQAKAQAFVEQAYPELVRGLRETCANLRIFPVSATGPLHNGDPAAPMQPYNLGQPLVWLLETSDRVRLERAQDYARRHARHLFRPDPEDNQHSTHYQVALARLDDFQRGIPSVALAEQARTLRAALVRKRRVRQVKHWVLALLVVLLLASAVGFVRDQAACRRIRVTLEDPQAEPHTVIADGRSLTQESGHWVGKSLGWWADLRQRVDTYELRHIQDEYEVLVNAKQSATEQEAQETAQQCERLLFHQALLTPAQVVRVTEVQREAQVAVGAVQAQTLFGEIETTYAQFGQDPKIELLEELTEKTAAFLSRFPESVQASQVQRIQAELKVAEAQVGEDTRSAKLQEALSKQAQDPWACYLLCVEWLAQPANLQGKHAREVTALRDGYLQQADDQAWNEILAFERKDPTYYSEVISKIDRDYLPKKLFTRHREEATKKQTARLRDWDQYLYERIVKRSLGGDSPQVILAVRDLCQEYRTAAIPQRAMASTVDRWLAWFNKLQAGTNFSVTVRSVRVGKGSRFHGTFYYPDVAVAVTVGKATHATGSKELNLDRDERDIPGNELSFFSWKWGEPDVVVTITCSDYGSETLKFTPQPQEDQFKVRFLNGRVPFDDGKIDAHLECPAVVPPRFPAYGGKE